MIKSKTKNENANNLREIREHLGFTQYQMAEILDVGIDMYRKYERWETLVPASRAKIIADKYNYSLDYIYNLAKKEKRTDQFMIDIREIISYKADKIFIKISDAYWKYLYAKNQIEKSNNTTQDKKNRMAELDSQSISGYKNVVWQTEFQISKEILQSYSEYGNDKVPCYFEDSKGDRLEILDERLEEAQNFFAKLMNYNEENE